MLDVKDQMLDALSTLHRCLEQPVEGMNETVRVICLKEVKDLTDNTRRQRIMPNPNDRDTLVMQHVMKRDAFPLPILVAVERYLELYLKAPLPEHVRPIVDSLDTASKVPLTRVRNIHWDTFTYEGSMCGRFLTWAQFIIGADLHKSRVADRIFAEQMQPAYEHDTASLQYKLFTRWNLADTLPDFCRTMQLPEEVFLVLRPDTPATDFLIHFQFMLTTWIEANTKRHDLSLKEAVLRYCMEMPSDVLAELMPPLAQIVVVDWKNRALYHFGVNHNQAQSMMRLWQPEYA